MTDQKIKTTGVSTITITVSDVETARKFLAAINRKNIKALIKTDCEIRILFDGLSNG